jgi:hypothetical protein
MAGPYESIASYVASADRPGWVAGVDEQLRVASYDVYSKIYWNDPNTYALVQRGSDTKPIYLPSGRTIVEAVNRYLATGMDFALTGGSDADKELAKSTMDTLFRREGFHSKFATQKRMGLIKGAQCWHIIGDDRKPEGRRISVLELSPGSAFAITDTEDPTKVIGWHVIAKMLDPNNPSNNVIRRQTYRKILDNSGTATISSELAYFTEDGWDDRLDPDTLKPFQELKPYSISSVAFAAHPPIDLDPRIQSLPVYVIPNKRTPESPWGYSELRGMERITAAINQAISDEELALAMEGLGLYTTTSGPPRDEAGTELNWIIGPGRVVEHDPDSDWKRVQGISSVAPVQEHLKALMASALDAVGVPDVALGKVDVKVAESGIALALEMSPLLAGNAEKEQEMAYQLDHLLYDLLTGWLPTYEGYQRPLGLDIAPVFGDPMPTDRAATIAEATALVGAGFWTVEQAQAYLSEKLGITFDLSASADLLKQERTLAIARDPFGQRLLGESEDVATTTPTPAVA